VTVSDIPCLSVLGAPKGCKEHGYFWA